MLSNKEKVLKRYLKLLKLSKNWKVSCDSFRLIREAVDKEDAEALFSAIKTNATAESLSKEEVFWVMDRVMDSLQNNPEHVEQIKVMKNLSKEIDPNTIPRPKITNPLQNSFSDKIKTLGKNSPDKEENE